MVEKTVDPVVEQLAQALHAATCVNRLTARHSWTEHLPVAAQAAQMIGLRGVGHRVAVAFKEGFDSRNQQVRDLAERADEVGRRFAEQAVELDKATDERTELLCVIDEERTATATALEAKQAAQREAADEKHLRELAEERARRSAVELAGANRALAAAWEANGLLQNARLHTAQALEAGTNGEGVTA